MLRFYKHMYSFFITMCQYIHYIHYIYIYIYIYIYCVCVCVCVCIYLCSNVWNTRHLLPFVVQCFVSLSYEHHMHPEKWLGFFIVFMLMVLSCFISTPWPCVLGTSATGQSSDLIHSDTVTNQRDSIILFTIWHMHLSSASHCSGGHENVSLFGLCSISHCWMLYKAHSTCRVSASQPTWSQNEVKVDPLYLLNSRSCIFAHHLSVSNEVGSLKKKSNKWFFFLTVSFAGNNFTAWPNS